jgi:nicotinamide-nucleotide amidase
VTTDPVAGTVALVLIGDELLNGHTRDANGPWLGRRLTGEGFRVVSATTTPDDVEAVVAAVQRGLADARAVLLTGGLGPTSDDVTRIALQRVAAGQVQEELANDIGSEAGARIQRGNGVVYAVPGVPAEMRSMVDGQVLPELIAATGGLSVPAVRSLVVVGMPEPHIAELLAPVEAQLVGRGGVGYLPRAAEVEVRIAATGAGAETVAMTATARAREVLGDVVAAVDQRLEEAVVELLRSHHRTIATAESLTGGLVCASLVSVPGASEVVRGAVVAYATELKADLVGVPVVVLERNGAVSSTTATAMAEGVRIRCRADLGVATTGVAGPDPLEGHPAATMHVAVAFAGGVRVGSFGPNVARRDRDTVRRLAVVRALDLVRRSVAGLGPGAGESSLRSTR